MTELMLAATEVVLSQGGKVCYNGTPAELILTNLNLIIKPKKKNRLLTKIRIRDIQLSGDNPQITVLEDKKRGYVLTLFCKNAAYQIDFHDAGEAMQWRDSTVRAMCGDFGAGNAPLLGKTFEQTAEARANERGGLSRTLFGLTKSVASAVRSGYDGIKVGLGIHDAKKKSEAHNGGDSIADYRRQEEYLEHAREQERLHRTKLALAYEQEMRGERAEEPIEETDDTKVPARAPSFCAGCGERLSADALFCHKCGTKVR